MVTSYDIAKRAEVSVGTVSRYLNDKGYVGRATRERIKQAIDELGYVPSSAARSLRTKRTGLIGLMLADLGNPFMVEVANGLSERASTHGLCLVVGPTFDDDELALRVLRSLRSHHIDGLVSTMPASRRCNDELVAMAESGMPLVLLGVPQLEPPVADRVRTQTYAGAREAVRHLVELGHRRIGFVGSPHRARGRRQAYLDELAEAGIAHDEALIVEGTLNRAGGEAALQRLVALPEPPTAIFAANDAAALGVIQGAYHHHLRIPAELSVVGFDDVDLAAHGVPPLTTVAQPTKQIGFDAIDLLVTRLDGPGPGPDPGEPVVRRLACELVVRSSTAPPPSGR